MKLLFSLTVLLALGCAQAPKKVEPQYPVYEKASQMPVEDFFRNPVLTGYKVSPDGKMLALLKPWKNRLNVFVHPVDDPSSQKQITFVEDRDIRRVSWKGPNHVYFHKDTGGNENNHVYVVEVSTAKVRDLTEWGPDTKSEVMDDLEESSDTDILVRSNQRNKEVFDVHRINVLTGASQMVATNDKTITNWIVDHAGKVRGGVASDGVNQVVYFDKGKGLEPIFKSNFRTAFFVVSFTADNKNLYAVTNHGSNFLRLVEVDPMLPSSKFIKRTIYTHGKFDLDDAKYSEARQAIGHVEIVTDRREIKFFHPDDQKDWDHLKGLFSKEGLVISNMTRDERTWVFKTYGDTTRGAFYAFNRDTRKITELGKVAPWIRPEIMSEMKSVMYRSRDGLDIQGYLTLPRGREAKNVPVVIVPHGGPWARDEWGFDPEAQLLASRGYAVFQPNFRGSTGFGRKFWEASFKQWGRKMQHDITDGVKWLTKNGVADPKRVCIYGASYGGYATLAGVAFTPDLYACAVDYVGVSNLLTFMKTIPPYWKPWLDQMYEMVGHPEKELAMMKAASPVYHVDKIKAPLFVAQGANDPRVVKAESDQIVDALRKRGVEVEYMVKDNEGHGFANEENRFDFYRAMEKFLAKHLGGSV